MSGPKPCEPSGPVHCLGSAVYGAELASFHVEHSLRHVADAAISSRHASASAVLQPERLNCSLGRRGRGTIA